jgi:hypothetical protein
MLINTVSIAPSPLEIDPTSTTTSLDQSTRSMPGHGSRPRSAPIRITANHTSDAPVSRLPQPRHY